VDFKRLILSAVLYIITVYYKYVVMRYYALCCLYLLDRGGSSGTSNICVGEQKSIIFRELKAIYFCSPTQVFDLP